MARVTVEDCVLRIPNRFELVCTAAQRAREISAGSPLTVDRDNDKNPVVALREIADDTVALDELRDNLVRGHQRVVEPDEPEDEIVELMAGEEEWLQKGVPEPAGEVPQAGADAVTDIGSFADMDVPADAGAAEEVPDAGAAEEVPEEGAPTAGWADPAGGPEDEILG